MKFNRKRLSIETVEQRLLLTGDMDENGVIDAVDIDLLQAQIAAGETDASLDLNGDSDIDDQDIGFLVNRLLRTEYGDSNLDGRVDFGDFLALSSRFGAAANSWAQSDFNGDGTVSFDDFLTLSSNFGFQSQSVRFVHFVVETEREASSTLSLAEIGVIDERTGFAIPQTSWTVINSVGEVIAADAELAMDDDVSTVWNLDSGFDGNIGFDFIVDLGQFHDIGGVSLLPASTALGSQPFEVEIRAGRHLESLETIHWGGELAPEPRKQLVNDTGVQFVGDRYIRLVADSEVNGKPWTTVAELYVDDHLGRPLDKSQWSLVSASSVEVVSPAPAELAFDGRTSSIWHTEWAPTGNENDPPHPHEIVIDLGARYEVGSFSYLPVQDMENGRIADFRFYTSQTLNDWGDPFAEGTFFNSPLLQKVTLAGDVTEQYSLLDGPDSLEADHTDRQIVVSLGTSHPQPEWIEYSAAIAQANPLAEIRDRLGISHDGNYLENLTGLNEKWLSGRDGNAYLLVPGGDLLHWRESFAETKQHEAVVAALGEQVYEDPSLLWAANPTIVAPSGIDVSIRGQDAIIDIGQGIYGEFTVQLTASVGDQQATKSIRLLIDGMAYELLADQLKSFESQLAEAEFEEIPLLLDEMAAIQQEATGWMAAQLGDLISEVQQQYNRSVTELNSNDAWTRTEQARREQQVAVTEWITSELQVIQAEHEAAWSRYQDQEPAAANPFEAPVFVAATPLGPFKIRTDEAFSLKLPAVHPTEIPSYAVKAGGVGYFLSDGTFQVNGLTPGIYPTTVVATVSSGASDEISFDIEIVPPPEPPKLVALVSESSVGPASREFRLTAHSAALEANPAIGEVQFWLDWNQDGTLDVEFGSDSRDIMLGRDSVSEDGWNWTGTLDGVAAGSYAVFALAKERILPGVFPTQFGPAVETEIEIVNASTETSLVEPLGDLVAADRFLSQRIHYGTDEFVEVFASGSSIAADWFDESGLVVHTVVASDFNAIGETPTFDVDQNGNVVIAYRTINGFQDADIMLVTVSPSEGIVTGPLRVSDAEAAWAHSPTISVADNGLGVIAWLSSETTERDSQAEPNDSLTLRLFSDNGSMLSEPMVAHAAPASPYTNLTLSSTINNAGDLWVHWKGVADIRANYSALSADAQAIAIAATSETHHVASNNLGWEVVGSVGFELDESGRRVRTHYFEVIDPNGNQSGERFLIADESETGLLAVKRMRVEDDGLLVVDLQQNLSEFFRRRFRVNLRDDQLTAEHLTISNAEHAEAGSSLKLDYRLHNASTTDASAAGELAFYLSHNGTISPESRLLGVQPVNAVLPNASTEVQTLSVNLPDPRDAFWKNGSSSLHLLMNVVGSPEVAAARLPYVRVPISTDVLTRYEFGDVSFDAPATPLTSPRYVDPASVLPPDKIESHNVQELIAMQLYASLHQLVELAERHELFELSHNINDRAERVLLQLNDRRLDVFLAKQAAEQQALERLEQRTDMATQSLLRTSEEYDQYIRETQQQFSDLIEEQRVIRYQSIEDAETERNREVDSQQLVADRARDKINEVQSQLIDLIDVRDELKEDLKAILNDPFSALEVLRQRLEETGKQIRNLRDSIPSWEEAKAFAESRIEVAKQSFLKTRSALRERYNEEKTKLEVRRDDLVKKYENARDAAAGYVERQVERLSESYTAELAQIAVDYAQPFSSLSDIPALQDTKIQGIIDVVTSPNGLIGELRPGVEQVIASNPLASLPEALRSISVASVGEVFTERANVIAGPIIEGGRELISYGAEQFIELADESGVTEWAEGFADDILNAEIVAYQASTEFDFSLNLSNASVYLQAKMGPGIVYDSKKLSDLLEGTFSLPDIDPVQAATRLYGYEISVTNNYTDVRADVFDEFGPQNVYFSSDRFVDYFGLETAATTAAELYVTGGSTTEQVLKEIGNQLRMEMNDILAWLEQKAQDELPGLVSGIIESLLTQEDFDSPHLEIRWTPVTYTYALQPNPLVGRVIEEVLGEEPDLTELIGQKELGVSLPNAGFSIIWKPADANPNENPLDPAIIDKALNNELNAFDFENFGGSSLSGDLVTFAIEELKNRNAPDIVLDVLQILATEVANAGTFEQRLAEIASEQLGIDAELLRDHYESGNPIIDLRDTNVADGLKDLLSEITFGNNGSVEIAAMSFNLSNFNLEITGRLIHKQTWGTVGDALDLLF